MAEKKRLQSGNLKKQQENCSQKLERVKKELEKEQLHKLTILTEVVELRERVTELESRMPKGMKFALSQKKVSNMREYAISIVDTESNFYRVIAKELGVDVSTAYKYCNDIKKKFVIERKVLKRDNIEETTILAK